MNLIEPFICQTKAGGRSTIKELEDLELKLGGDVEEDRLWCVFFSFCVLRLAQRNGLCESSHLQPFPP